MCVCQLVQNLKLRAHLNSIQFKNILWIFWTFQTAHVGQDFRTLGWTCISCFLFEPINSREFNLHCEDVSITAGEKQCGTSSHVQSWGKSFEVFWKRKITNWSKMYNLNICIRRGGVLLFSEFIHHSVNYRLCCAIHLTSTSQRTLFVTHGCLVN